MTDKITKIAIFRNKEIRKTIHKNEWWFSVVDVIEALTGTDRSRKYWSDLKKRLIQEGYAEVSEKIGQLKLRATDGKLRETDCADTETLFRIVQSVPSPKAELFKRWLAKVGYERIQEIEDPELAQKGLKRENLRDHMNDLELLFSQLGEAATTEITKTEHPQGFEKNRRVS